MILPAEFIAEAREWIGTPYHDQASAKGIGCDCVGLFKGVGRCLGVSIEMSDDYPPQPSGERMLEYLRGNCIELDLVPMRNVKPGTLMALTTRAEPGPHHIALRTDSGMLHAWGLRIGGKGGKVIEHGLMWPNLVHSLWWHPEVAG